MAVRFINPAQTPYQSQFVPLPIDYMAQNLDAKQKAFDGANAKLAESAITLKETPWTIGSATKYADTFNKELEGITNNLMSTGNVNQAMMKLSSTNKRFLNDPVAQKYIRDAEFYEKEVAPMIGKPEFNSAYIPEFQNPDGTWKNIDYTTPEGSQYLTKSPSIITDQTDKYLQENVFNNLKGVLVQQGIDEGFNVQTDPETGVIYYKNPGGQTVQTIDPRNPNDKYTRQALSNWSTLIADPEQTPHAQAQYIREKIGADSPEAILDFITKKGSPFFTGRFTEDPGSYHVLHNPYTDGGGKALVDNASAFTLVDVASQPTEGLTPMSLASTMSELNRQALQTEQRSIELAASTFSTNQNVMSKIAPVLGISGSDIRSASPALINQRIEALKQNPRQYEAFVNTLNSAVVQEYARVMNDPNADDTMVTNAEAIIAGIGQAGKARQEISKFNNLYGNISNEFNEDFLNNPDKYIQKNILDKALDVIKYTPTAGPAYAFVNEKLGRYGSAQRKIDDKDFVEFVINSTDEEIKSAFIDPANLNPQEKIEALRSARSIKQYHDDAFMNYKPSAAIKTGERLIVPDSDKEGTPSYFVKSTLKEGWIPTLQESDLLYSMFGDEYNKSDKNALSQIFEANPYLISKDVSFDPDEARMGDIADINLSTDASGGLSMYLTFEQKHGDEDNKGSRAMVRMPVSGNGTLESSIMSNLIKPMIYSSNLNVQDRGYSLLTQLNIDNRERGLLMGMSATNVTDPKGLTTTVDFNVPGSDPIKFRITKTNANQFSVVNETTGKRLGSANGTSYEELMQVMGAGVKQTLAQPVATQTSSGGSSGGKFKPQGYSPLE